MRKIDGERGNQWLRDSQRSRALPYTIIVIMSRADVLDPPVRRLVCAKALDQAFRVRVRVRVRFFFFKKKAEVLRQEVGG